MNIGFYRGLCMLPFTLQTNGYRACQEEVVRPEGLPLCAQFSICTGGVGEFWDDTGRRHIIRRGDIFYFAPDTPHKYKNISDDWSVKYIIVSGSATAAFMRKTGYLRSGVIRAGDDTYNKMLSIWDIIDIHHTDLMNKKSIAQMSVMCYKTLVELSRVLNNSTSEARAGAVRRLLPVLSVINTKYGEDLSLDYLSSFIGVSPTYLCRLFKTAFNCTPVTYIKNVRMERARNLLQGQKNRPVREIAEECGFSDASYFGKIFKKAFGISPDRFRMSSTYGKEIENGQGFTGNGD